MPSAAADLLGDLARALERLALRWYVFGAQAVMFHGRPRLTEDVDVTVELGATSSAELVAALETEGFRVADIADDEFVATTRVLPLVHVATGMALDIVLAGPGLEELFLAEAELTKVGDQNIPVIRAEHLIVTKILAARPKDLEDARELSSRRDLDLEVIRALLAELEAALGQSDLLPTFEAIVAGSQ